VTVAYLSPNIFWTGLYCIQVRNSQFVWVRGLEKEYGEGIRKKEKKKRPGKRKILKEEEGENSDKREGR
jgi:hypothetical protein